MLLASGLAEGTLVSEIGVVPSLGTVADTGGGAGDAGEAAWATEFAIGSSFGLTGVSTAGGDITTGAGFELVASVTGVFATWVCTGGTAVTGFGIRLSGFGTLVLGLATAGLEARGVSRISCAFCWFVSVLLIVAGFVAGFVAAVVVLGWV